MPKKGHLRDKGPEKKATSRAVRTGPATKNTNRTISKKALVTKFCFTHFQVAKTIQDWVLVICLVNFLSPSNNLGQLKSVLFSFVYENFEKSSLISDAKFK